MIGAPVPCGVVLTRRQYVSRIARLNRIIGTLDTTIAGSRPHRAPDDLVRFQRHGLEGFQSNSGEVPHCS